MALHSPLFRSQEAEEPEMEDEREGQGGRQERNRKCNIKAYRRRGMQGRTATLSCPQRLGLSPVRNGRLYTVGQ